MTDQPKPPAPSLADLHYAQACQFLQDKGASGNIEAANTHAVLSLRCSVVELIELLTEHRRREQ